MSALRKPKTGEGVLRQEVEALKKLVIDLRSSQEAMAGCLEYTQREFTKFAEARENRIEKQIDIQREFMTKSSQRMTDIEVELGLAEPTQRLVPFYVQPTKYRVVETETENPEDED